MSSHETVSGKPLTVRELFENDAIYRIPDYQRNFAWQATAINQLIEDIRTAHAHDKGAYFLGNLVTTQLQAEDGTPVYQVVDGQQRLTTLVLLLSYLMLDKNVDRSHVKTPPPRHLDFATRPQARQALSKLTDELSANTRTTGFTFAADGNAPAVVTALDNGLSAIRSELEKLPARERTELLNFCWNHVRMIRIVLPPHTDLNRYFEVMNTRSKQLGSTDIVKSRLMSYLGDDDIARTTFEKVWEACADMDTYIQMALTPGDKARRKVLFGDDWELLQITEFDRLSDELLTGVDTTRTSSSSDRRLAYILARAEESDAERADRDTDETDDTRGTRATITFSSFLLHVLKIFRIQRGLEPGLVIGDEESDVREESLDERKIIERFHNLFVVDIEGRGHSKDVAVKEFILLMLRARNMFDRYVIRRSDGVAEGDGTWQLKKFLHQDGNEKKATRHETFPDHLKCLIRSGKNEVKRTCNNDVILLESLIRITYTSQRTMHWITHVLRAALDTHFPGNGTVVKGDEGTLRQFGDRLRTLLTSYIHARIPTAYRHAGLENGEEPQGFSIPRIVFTYLDYLLLESELFYSGEDKEDPPSWQNFTFQFRNSIEHFAPQKRSDGTDPEGLTAEDKNLLGNLALVTARHNSKFSNATATAKAASSDYGGIHLSSPKLYRMAQLARTDTGWTRDQIIAHTHECLTMLRDTLRTSSNQ